ncbi:DUF2238 domain-containing protein [Alkalibacter mobilis]|uniref:DUF2238 domain-containing protein n=1 Tax=Alkalibacter mobilis TaxID=2787712 RepID=UPI0018A01E59|nr:DUF2238 domain-containing protein [Alkalibacter mobilis]MBF7096214.1 DUF2238 domain-containing protein [Alkalibacter mobilis]
MEPLKDVKRLHKIFLGIFGIVLVWSAIDYKSLITWFLEAFPAIVFVLVLVIIYNRVRFSDFVYAMILLHVIVLLWGAKHTYEENPLFDFLMNRYDLARNYYDRVGHFFQGLVPALMAKEILLSRGYMKRNKMFYFTVIAMILGISAFYELLEFAVSRISGVPGYMVLSYQGDEWDTQWDMTTAMIGALISLGLLRKFHDRQMEKHFMEIKNIIPKARSNNNDSK